MSHSNHGEFAYRDGPWKLVFKNTDRLDKVRGQKREIELYHLEDDIAEAQNLAPAKPQKVAELTQKLEELVKRGSSRPGQKSSNDTRVIFDTTQEKRWADKAE